MVVSTYADDCRELARMRSAIDAPFEAMAKDKWERSAPARAAARSAAAASGAGLVKTKNKGTGRISADGYSGDASEAVQIDPHARRVHRMRSVLEHAMRLSESSLFRFGGFRHRRVFVTLTYRPGRDWEARDIGDYLRIVRKWSRRRRFDLRYVWVAELQERGAVHYHVCLWVPKRVYLPRADVSGWWSHGSTRVEQIRAGVVGVMSYMRKYLSKAGADSAHKFPKGARMYGVGGLDIDSRQELRFRCAPYWVADRFIESAGDCAIDIRRIVGGWVNRVTGEFVRSPWRVFVDGAGRVWAIKQSAELAA